MELGAGSLENHRSAKLTRGERAGKLAGAVECQKHVGERAEGRRGHGHGGGATLDWMMAFGLEGQSRLRTLVHQQTITFTMTNFLNSKLKFVFTHKDNSWFQRLSQTAF